MNTDNMSISGETIDYGPCAFLENYRPDTVFSSIDELGRYAFANQPSIAQWNLARLAETLLSLIDQDREKAVAVATDIIKAFPDTYRKHWLQRMRVKLGLLQSEKFSDKVDSALIEAWLSLLHQHKIDFTLAFRYLADAAEGKTRKLLDLFNKQTEVQVWLDKWQNRCADEDKIAAQKQNPLTNRAQVMRKTNPWIIPRNHRVEEALSAAWRDHDLEPFEQLLAALQHPYEENPDLIRYTEPASQSFTACYRTFCGT